MTGWMVLINLMKLYLCLTEEHNLHINAVTHAELLTGYNKFAVTTIPDEGWTAARAHHDHTIGAQIDEALVMIIMHVDVALYTLLDSELLSIQRAIKVSLNWLFTLVISRATYQTPSWTKS